ncbi:hypothetical protein [Kitasatospora sp. NPDC088346]
MRARLDEQRRKARQVREQRADQPVRRVAGTGVVRTPPSVRGAA